MLFFLMAGLRGDTVGGDLKRYLPEFYSVAKASFPNIFEAGHHEPGYLIYIKLLSLISPDSRMFLLGTSFLSMIGPFVLFTRCSKNTAVSVLLYYAMGYYTNTFNNVRQSMALSLVFCVIPYLIERKFWRYLLGVVIATTFHYSAIIMLIIYPLSKNPITFKQWAIFSVGSLAFVSMFFFTFFRYLAVVFLEKYDPESIFDESDGSGYGLFVVYFFIFIVMSAYYFASKGKLKPNAKSFLSLMLLFQLMAASIQLAAPIFHSMVRMTHYFFIPVMTLAIPYIYSTLKSKQFKQMLYVGAFSFVILYMGLIVYKKKDGYNTNSQGAIPYIFLKTEIF